MKEQESLALTDIVEALGEHIENSVTCHSLVGVLKENAADIPADEENQVACQQPRQFTRISSFESNDEAKNLTNFNKEELTTMLTVEHSNWPGPVRVPVAGGVSSSVFHGEELWIHMLIKMQSGDTHARMADAVTHHGDSR
jgi:hypothetical protein